MAGFAVDGNGLKVVFADNVDFSGGATPTSQVLTDGTLLIGSTAAPHIKSGTLTAGPGITITNGSGSITIGATGFGMNWQTISASQTLVVSNGYICVSPGGALSLVLPATATIGDEIEITLDGATSFTVTQAAGQQIRIGNVQTTLGAGGSLATTAQGNTVRMVAQSATKWNVVSMMGNITVV